MHKGIQGAVCTALLAMGAPSGLVEKRIDVVFVSMRDFRGNEHVRDRPGTVAPEPLPGFVIEESSAGLYRPARLAARHSIDTRNQATVKS